MGDYLRATKTKKRSFVYQKYFPSSGKKEMGWLPIKEARLKRMRKFPRKLITKEGMKTYR